VLGADAARQGKPVRAAFAAGLKPLIDILAKFVPGASKAARRRKALAVMSQLVGAMVLARAVDDPALSDEILAAAKAELLRGQ
jgi:TetR/AcrR family transcriptional repressor of nem operon